MTKIMRADVYRILKSKSLYFAVGFTMFIVILVIVIDYTTKSENAGTGAITALQMPTIGEAMIYFIMPLFITTAMPMFSCNAVKNDLSSGISRVRLYCSKWVLSTSLCLLNQIIFFSVGILTASLLTGVGDWSGGVIPTFVKASCGQTLILLAMNSVGLFFAFATRNSAATICAYIAFGIVPLILIPIFLSYNPIMPEFLKYSPFMIMRSFSQVESLSVANITINIVAGVGLLAVSTISGILLFKRAEMK